MQELKAKLVSRKFLVAVAGVCAALANNDINGAVLIVLGFIGVQGAIDHKNAG